MNNVSITNGYFLFKKAGLSIGGADVGMNLGMFTLGMLIPWSNTIVSLYFYSIYQINFIF